MVGKIKVLAALSMSCQWQVGNVACRHLRLQEEGEGICRAVLTDDNEASFRGSSCVETQAIVSSVSPVVSQYFPMFSSVLQCPPVSSSVLPVLSSVLPICSLGCT